MKLLFLLNHTSKLTKLIIDKEYGASDSIKSYQRMHKQLGSSDRKFVTELAMIYLRHKDLIDHIRSQAKCSFEYDYLAVALILANYFPEFALNSNINLIFHRIFKSDNLSSVIGDSFSSCFATNCNLNNWIGMICNEYAVMQNLSMAYTPSLTFSTFYSLKLFLLESLNQSLSNSELIENLKFLNSPASTFIRAKALHYDSVKSELEQQRISFEEFTYPPFCIKLNERPNLTALKSFKSGHFEVQDISSQIITDLIPLDGAISILDACAGAGGKTLNMLDKVNDKTLIHCYDTRADTLDELNLRAKRAGLLKQIKIVNKSDILKEKYDIVLLDSPCSGFGTIRRDPAIKLKLTPGKLSDFKNKELHVLGTYYNSVKLNGFLVYVTCSLLYEENQSVISEFLAVNPGFSIYSEIQSIHAKFSINGIAEYLLTPLNTGGDGFYCCVLRRNEI